MTDNQSTREGENRISIAPLYNTDGIAPYAPSFTNSSVTNTFPIVPEASMGIGITGQIMAEYLAKRRRTK
mgnify:CR=1 FL=1